MNSKYKIGDEVQSISDPNLIGTIVEICEFHADVQWYRVNFGPAGRPKKPEMDLRPFVPADSPKDNLLKGNIDGYQEFQRLITYQRLLRDHPLRNNIYAFNASRTRFYPYQFKPLLKFLDSPKNRLLIADEVGLGKTIEAGLILTELKARQTIQKVLVVCPANLTDEGVKSAVDCFAIKGFMQNVLWQLDPVGRGGDVHYHCRSKPSIIQIFVLRQEVVTVESIDQMSQE